MKPFLRTNGFSMVEILVVIGIIGLLSVLAAVSIGFARNQARIQKATHDVDAILTAIRLLENDTGQWPSHLQVDVVASPGSELWDLNALLAGLTQNDGLYMGWNGPYMAVVRPDPWGQNYFFDPDYTINGEPRVVVGSFGPDTVGPNLFDADDIIKIFR